MTSLIQPNLTGAGIYVDYENIFELLKCSGVNPIEIKFFPVILNRLRDTYKLNILESIAYSNFERKPLQNRHQTMLQAMGIQTRHSSNNGKNSGDLELTVDALKSLYKNPAIEVFVIISSDRDIIPLIKAIRYENKTAFVISTRNGFNQIIVNYANYHEYIEDIFNLPPVPEVPAGDREGNPSHQDLDYAEEVCQLLFNSNIWRKYKAGESPITLKGYVDSLSSILMRDPVQITKDFYLANELGLIEIYKHPKKGLCIRKVGDNDGESEKINNQ
jgi:hypothetical protein